MFLKRKRSESDLSLSSTLPSPSAGTSNDHGFDLSAIASVINSQKSFSTIPLSTPSHLHSRTMKRYRNNRPSEEEVHQRTLSLLYAAQQQQQQQQHHEQHQAASPALKPHQQQQLSTVNAVRPTVTPQKQQQASRGQQRSLHSFWNLPAAPVTTSSSHIFPATSSDNSGNILLDTPTSCEDCGAGPSGNSNGSSGNSHVKRRREGGGDHDVDMMDISTTQDGSGYEQGNDEYDSSLSQCEACGKMVCFSCSISNLGEHRRCLACAERRVWVG
ncbi:hypothetical protein SMACR_12616 [Sordaria macrospora]|uniref:WGS project CABT00000000 data, contig 2.1 n=2 Tax=Sordaria macrospora TaxID=5147 RepID=F7VM73_SORMK|nr:uncharacterized protein SMAC_12616 [Sordaria macrospora k-hell]KAA8629862.1 hypothetical protein SMACR_12616 [Sordaria macrospora]KAH7625972.1 hypothetical protein B0T09DRAFT_61206 [Sordaria sp. MPI-SDFR-AT-0083]WPJ65825.1 hypothetical protein SMAC4_12616 [Sordaria macrospora]CCC06601.1 unnamed protein product [Sordaria macrospora k-hell]